MQEIYDLINQYPDKKFHVIEIDDIVFLVREISWKEGLEIDARSFRKKEDLIYQNTEYEKREILKIAITKAFDKKANITISSKYESNILEYLDHVLVEKLWVEYQNYLFLSADEANFFYSSTKKYFDPNNAETFPVHPLIIEVDYMTRGIVSMSTKEFSNLSMKEFETIQIIIATKNEVGRNEMNELTDQLD
jgi:hypothetical protein